jgi:hypothetical protein
MQKVMKSLGWRRGGGGVGSDRGAESDEEEEAVAPTQAAPDEGEEEGGGGGLFSRVGGWIGLGRSGGAKRKRPEEEEDNDEDDEGIATTASMRKRADDQARERRTRASQRKLRASAPASSPRASSPAGSPGRTKIDGARRKRRKGPLGNSNRHSKRAALEANVPSLPRKKRVMWTPEETAALEAGVRAMEKEGRFDMGATDLRDGTVNDKWRRIYDMHKETFDVNGRTTMDLKDKWRNVVNAEGKIGRRRRRRRRRRVAVELASRDDQLGIGQGAARPKPATRRNPRSAAPLVPPRRASPACPTGTALCARSWVSRTARASARSRGWTRRLTL